MEQVANSAHAVLDTIYGGPVEVILGSGSKVFVRKIRVKDMNYMITFMGEVVEWLGVDDDGNVTFDYRNPKQLIALVGKFPDEVKKIVGMLSTVPADVFDDLELDDALKIIVAVVEVNYHFFIEKVLPQLSLLKAKVGLTQEDLPATI